MKRIKYTERERKTKYPYEDWLKEAVVAKKKDEMVVLELGSDFHCKPLSMMYRLRRAGYDIGMGLHVRVYEDRIEFRGV